MVANLEEAPRGADGREVVSGEIEDGAGDLPALRARMKKNADESRAALDREKEARKMSEQRLAALERLMGFDNKKKASRFSCSFPCQSNIDDITTINLDFVQSRWRIKRNKSTCEKPDGRRLRSRLRRDD